MAAFPLAQSSTALGTTPPLPRFVVLQSYLHAFEYSNTVYLDLWEHLQKVSNMPSPLRS